MKELIFRSVIFRTNLHTYVAVYKNTKGFYGCCFCGKPAHDVQKALDMGL